MSKDVRPFEEYKEMIKDMRKEEMIKGLYDLSARITEQDKEIERLNNIINELEKELNKDFNTYMTGNRQNGKVYKAGADNYRMHIYLKLQELKGSE